MNLISIILSFAISAGEGEPKPLSVPFNKVEAETARAAWAKHLQIPERRELQLGKSVKLELVLIPPGKFRMGSTATERKYVRKHFDVEIKGEDERDVTISKPFYLAVTETTQEQYEAIFGPARNISWFNPTGGGKAQIRGQDCAKRPAERVNWNDANDFCEAFNEKFANKLKSRLPTEAEWEYACQAGTTTPFHFGDKLNGREANCNGSLNPFGLEEKGPFLQWTMKAASYSANGFGLFDMHGNICEWCGDFYGEDTKTLSAIDPFRSSKLGKSLHVLRGGGWDSPPYRCRAAERAFAPPDRRDNAYGFRICVPVE